MRNQVANLVVVSDLHCGCRLGLCPPGPIPLDGEGAYTPSAVQRKVWGWWREFWDEWVPRVCHGEPYAVLVNGDSLEGVHHGATTQVSQNLADQAAIARLTLAPIVQACEGRFYMVRGTEAHVGPSGAQEETLARELGARPDREGRSARYDLWVSLGRGLIHALHHIGTSGSLQYEATAICKELVESYAEAGRWRNRRPDVLVRSHRHRLYEVRCPTDLGYGIAFTTAGWQLKTPLAWRAVGARQTTPQIGGSVIRQGDTDLYTRHWVQTIARSAEVRL